MAKYLPAKNFAILSQGFNPNSLAVVGELSLKPNAPNAGLGAYKLGCGLGNGMCGLGAWTDVFGSLNIPTMLGIGLAGLFGYQLLFGYAGRSRRKELSKAKADYSARRRAILRKYPRHSFYARAGE